MPYWSADVTIVSGKSAKVRWQDGLWSMVGDFDFPPGFLAELHVRALEALANASGRPPADRSGGLPDPMVLRRVVEELAVDVQNVRTDLT
jgi:hypothetical protein